MPYERPITARYSDPYELVWMATARRLGLHIRRNPAIFSMTDGSGLLELGPRDDLDPDDTAAQMIFHELCHWITNGTETFSQRDWGFPVTDEDDWREYSCLRLQAALADRHGLRRLLAPTGQYRAYYDQIPPDAFAPLTGDAEEARVLDRAAESLARADAAPFDPPLSEALASTAAIHRLVGAFLPSYATDVPDDALPSLWGRDER